jgi:hypothetical protein
MFEKRTLIGQPVDSGAGIDLITIAAEIVSPQGIDPYDDYIAPDAAGAAADYYKGRDKQDGKSSECHLLSYVTPQSRFCSSSH